MIPQTIDDNRKTGIGDFGNRQIMSFEFRLDKAPVFLVFPPGISIENDESRSILLKIGYKVRVVPLDKLGGMRDILKWQQTRLESPDHPS